MSHRQTLTLFALLTAAGCAHLPAPSSEPLPQICRGVVPASAAVTWVESTDARSRASIARWCATVGPVLYDPLPTAPRTTAATSSLILVSWNVHVGSGDVAGLIRRLRRGELTGGTPVGEFVLLLQESYRRDGGVPVAIPRGVPTPRRIAASSHRRGPDVQQLARDHGLGLLYAPSMRNGRAESDAEDRGNAILSTLPLQDPAIVDLPLEHQRRVVAVAAVEGQTPGGIPWRLRLVDAHFDTALALRHGGPFEARRRQADALVRALADSDAATILAGDFNSWWGDREPAIDVLRRAFPATPPFARAPTWRGPLGSHAALDYVFARGAIQSLSVRRLSERFGSDHYPLLAIVGF